MIKKIVYIIHLIIKGQLKLVFYLIYNKLRGIDLTLTSCEDLGLSSKISNWHTSSGGPDLDVVLRSLNINCNDSILDVGCGKAGAIITLSKYPFHFVDGVDISEELISIASANMKKANCRGNTNLFCTDASTFNRFDKYNYIYMFNPFPCKIMDLVLSNINNSITNYPREFTIIYKNPVCHETIDSKSKFELISKFNHSDHPFCIYRNSINQ